MLAHAAPVSIPPFRYTTNDFYVEIDHHRHGRCSSSRLHDLLTHVDPGPAYTKAGKLRVHQPAPHKDETQHFYEAQLRHYGLKPLKSKPAAKNALLAAFNGGKILTVPESILKIERKLAAEYKIKNEVAEKEYRQEKQRQKEAEEKERKKRKREENDLLAEILDEPSSTSARAQKKAKPSKAPKKLNIRELSGAYTIAAPEVSNGWDCNGPLTLKLAPSSTASHLWGSFDFGVFEGKLRSSSSVTPTDNTIEFLWRGCETGEGESTYGPTNVAKFKFLGNGKFSGTMYWDCLGEFKLVGKLDEAASRNKVFQKNVPGWKSNFWSINDSNYERERVGRWGGGYGYGGDDEDEAESNSDTGNSSKDSEEEGSEDEEEELYEATIDL